MDSTLDLPDWDEIDLKTYMKKHNYYSGASSSSFSMSPEAQRKNVKQYHAEEKRGILEREFKEMKDNHHYNDWKIFSNSEPPSPQHEKKPPSKRSNSISSRDPSPAREPTRETVPSSPAKKNHDSSRDFRSNTNNKYIPPPSPSPPSPKNIAAAAEKKIPEPKTNKSTFIPSNNNNHESFLNMSSNNNNSTNKENNYHHHNNNTQNHEIPRALLFEFRTLFLTSTEQLQTITNLFQNILSSIERDNEFDSKNILTLLTSLQSLQSSKINPSSISTLKSYQKQLKQQVHDGQYLHLPINEILLFDSIYQQLSSLIIQFFQILNKTIENKKLNYFQQFKKFKELSNQAISNMLQYERNQQYQISLQWKEYYEKEMEKLKLSFQDEKESLHDERKKIEDSLMKTQTLLQEMYEKEKLLQNQLQDSIKQGIKEQKIESEKEKIKLKEFYQNEMNLLKEEMDQQLKMIQKTHEKSVQEMKNSEKEKREMVELSKTNLERECEYLRNENAKLTAEMSSFREQSQYHLHEVIDKYERQLQEKMANDLQNQATMKNEIANILQRVQKEEERRKIDLEENFQKMRNNFLTNQALEIEKLHDRHRSEMRRFQAELETQHQEAIYKLKHMHEQELNRQIRENDRLQRLLARQGISTALNSESGSLRPSSSSSLFNHNFGGVGLKSSMENNNKPVYHSLTPGRESRSVYDNRDQPQQPQQQSSSPRRHDQKADFNFTSKTSYFGDKKEEREEMPRKPQEKREEEQKFSNNFPSTYSNNNNSNTQNNNNDNNLGVNRSRKLNWGFLEQSLKAQEENIPKFSSSHLPPNTLPLDEAYESSKQKSTDGIGISSNSKKVSNYLQQLEDYLQGKDDAVFPTNPLPLSTAIATPHEITDFRERKNYALSTIHDDSPPIPQNPPPERLSQPIQFEMGNPLIQHQHHHEDDTESLEDGLDLAQLAQLPLEISSHSNLLNISSSGTSSERGGLNPFPSFDPNSSHYSQYY